MEGGGVKFDRIKRKGLFGNEIQFWCCANQLTGFYIRATLVLNGLNRKNPALNSNSASELGYITFE